MCKPLWRFTNGKPPHSMPFHLNSQCPDLKPSRMGDQARWLSAIRCTEVADYLDASSFLLFPSITMSSLRRHRLFALPISLLAATSIGLVHLFKGDVAPELSAPAAQPAEGVTLSTMVRSPILPTATASPVLANPTTFPSSMVTTLPVDTPLFLPTPLVTGLHAAITSLVATAESTPVEAAFEALSDVTSSVPTGLQLLLDDLLSTVYPSTDRLGATSAASTLRSHRIAAHQMLAGRALGYILGIVCLFALSFHAFDGIAMVDSVRRQLFAYLYSDDLPLYYRCKVIFPSSRCHQLCSRSTSRVTARRPLQTTSTLLVMFTCVSPSFIGFKSDD